MSALFNWGLGKLKRRKQLLVFSVILTLVGIILVALQIIAAPELASLPSGSRNRDPSNTSLDGSKLLVSINVKGQGQSSKVEPGETVSVTCAYQIYSYSNPNEINQGFFILSWTPTWPPPAGYYVPIWNGISGLYPGTGQKTTSFSFTAPSAKGTYYLYWCSNAHYNMQLAVSQYSQPLDAPAHAKIVIGPYSESASYLTYVGMAAVVGGIATGAGVYFDSLWRKRKLMAEARVKVCEIGKEDLESVVLEYAKTHKGKMQISKCSAELGISEAQVRETLSRLKGKGLIKMEQEEENNVHH